MKTTKITLAKARKEAQLLADHFTQQIDWSFDVERMAKAFKSYYNNTRGDHVKKLNNAKFLIDFYSHTFRNTVTINL